MSTFGGKIEEIPDISVDRFDGKNINSSAYFLSHCHSDHMVGLDNSIFWKNLANCNKFLYTSEISCTILTKKYCNLNVQNIKPLCFYTPTTIAIQNESLLVTIIPAGHSPGSVMFLFENGFKKILYTGDYRIHKTDIAKFKQLHDYLKGIKNIDKIYLDTTFFSKSFDSFPKRTDSIKEICRIIEIHIKHGREYHIFLQTGAYYGYEKIFQEIYKKFGMAVHVRETEYSFYKCIPNLDLCVTIDGSKTQIHNHCGGYKKMCNLNFNSKLLILNISAYIWDSEALTGGISQYDGKSTYNICYSTHASLEEGIQLIQLLKPKEIEVCVKNTDRDQEMNEIINKLLKDIHSPEKCVLKPQYFSNSFKVKKKLYHPKKYSEVYTSDILRSPPMEKRLSSCTSSKEILSPLKSPFIINISENSQNENVKQELTSESNEDISQSFERGFKNSSEVTGEESEIISEDSENILLRIIEGKEFVFKDSQRSELCEENIHGEFRSVCSSNASIEESEQLSEESENILTRIIEGKDYFIKSSETNEFCEENNHITNPDGFSTDYSLDTSVEGSEIISEDSENILTRIIEGKNLKQ